MDEMTEALHAAWNEYDNGDGNAVASMFELAFQLGYNAAIDSAENEAANQRKRDECVGRYGA